MTLNENEEKALRYAIPVMDRWVKDGKVYILDLDEEVQEISSFFISIYQSKGVLESEREFIGYEVSIENSQKMWRLAKDSSKAADLIRQKISVNLLHNFAMNGSLAMLAGAILRGDYPLATPKAVRPSMKHRDTLLVGIAKRVSRDFGMSVGANPLAFEGGELPPIRGCTIAAAALAAFDVYVRPETANKIVGNKSFLVKNLESDFIFHPQFKSLSGISSPSLFYSANDFPEEMEKAKIYLASPL